MSGGNCLVNKEMTKIIFVINRLIIGGPQKVVVFLANYLVELGYDVSIISLSAVPPTLDIHRDVDLRFLGYEQDHVQSSVVTARVLMKAKMIYHLRRAIRTIEPSLICAFMPGVVRLVLMATTGLSCPVVGSERGNPYLFSHRKLKQYESAYRKCSVVVFQTEKSAMAFSDVVRSVVIPNPCTPRVKPIEPHYGDRRKIIVGAGRLEPEKGFDNLIRSFEKVLKKHPEYCLYIFGEGNERARLKAMIDDNGLNDNVVLKGEERDVFREAKDCTAFVLSSLTEGMPNVLMEALSIGIPCIATDCDSGGPSVLLDQGRRGLLVPVGDNDALADAMCTYIDNPRLSEDYGQAALEVNTQFASELIAEAWLDLFTKVLKGNSEAG